MKYMKDNSDIFPEAEIANIIEKVKHASSAFSSLQEFVIHLIKKLDPNGVEVIPFNDFINGLKTVKILLTNHEEHILHRRFDHNNDNTISMEEFYNSLAKNF